MTDHHDDDFEQTSEGLPELDELRALWDALDPPPTAEERDDEPEDPATRAALEWMRAAWDVVEAPRRPLPLAVPREVASRPRWAWSASGLVAGLAAALLAWLGVRSAPDARSEQRAGSPDPRAVAVRPIEPPVLLASLRGDGSVETRAGKVRLVLCPPTLPKNEREKEGQR